MRKIPCGFHPQENVLQFCCNKECLLPMCKNCINIHLQQHQQDLTAGKFQNIITLYVKIVQQLSQSLESLMILSDRMKIIFIQRQSKKKALIKELKKFKQEFLNSIATYLQSIEKFVVQSIERNSTQLQLQFNKTDLHIQKTSEKIREEIVSLTGQKILKGMIKYMGDSDTSKQQIQQMKSAIQKIETSSKSLEFYNDKINMDYCKTIILQCYKAKFSSKLLEEIAIYIK